MLTVHPDTMTKIKGFKTKIVANKNAVQKHVLTYCQFYVFIGKNGIEIKFIKHVNSQNICEIHVTLMY